MSTSRRNFLGVATGAAAAAMLAPVRAPGAAEVFAAPAAPATGADDRTYWAAMLQRVAEPVLADLAQNK